jgi:signal peptide peptidase SppA
MSDFAARAALTRINLREVALASHYTGMLGDLQALSAAEPGKAEKAFMERRTDICAAYGFNTAAQSKPFAFAAGLAIIPITGTLINRYGSSYEGYVTGYNFIRRQLQMAMADDDVLGIVFDVNSFGGEAAGCFELAAEIRAARAIKPSMAIVDSSAYSAGYALASAAGKVVAIPSAGVGSVGVITAHVDMSQMLEKWGVKVTLIYEAEHKADGNSYEPLPADVRSEVQARIGQAYNRFVGVVAENLGIDEKTIRDTKSRTYTADAALSLGLIHAIASPSSAAQAFLDELSGSTTNLRLGAKMSTAQSQEPGAADQASTQAAAASAAQEARVAERARVSGILGCEEAKGREAMANHLATKTDMSLEDAKALLAAAPVPTAAAPATANPFESAMNATANPNVGADAASGVPGADSPVNAILADFKAATGRDLAGK